MIKLLKLFHNNLPIRATKTGGFSISLNEVNSESQPNLEILMQFERSENYVPYFLQTLVSLGTLMQFERSENYDLYFSRTSASLGTLMQFERSENYVPS